MQRLRPPELVSCAVKGKTGQGTILGLDEGPGREAAPGEKAGTAAGGRGV